MKTKITALALLAVTAGVFAFTRTTIVPLSGLRDAAADNAKPGDAGAGASVAEKGGGGSPAPNDGVPAAAGASEFLRGGSLEDDLTAGASVQPVEWVAIPGGKFTMGTGNATESFEDAKPIHEVVVETFEMSKTAVTVEQYAECVIKGRCSDPGIGGHCNWGKPGRQLHPVNCVDWDQANQYAGFIGARLPSESEWEYAARSGGKNRKYPWGDKIAACDKAVMSGNSGYGCGAGGTMPVCSKPAGNTDQGLCDMAGNVWQWVQDKYQNSYTDAPADGGAFEGAGASRVVRGGSFGSEDARNLRADYRNFDAPGRRNDFRGFRLARSSR